MLKNSFRRYFGTRTRKPRHRSKFSTTVLGLRFVDPVWNGRHRRAEAGS